MRIYHKHHKKSNIWTFYICVIKWLLLVWPLGSLQGNALKSPNRANEEDNETLWRHHLHTAQWISCVILTWSLTQTQRDILAIETSSRQNKQNILDLLPAHIPLNTKGKKNQGRPKKIKQDYQDSFHIKIVSQFPASALVVSDSHVTIVIPPVCQLTVNSPQLSPSKREGRTWVSVEAVKKILNRTAFSPQLVVFDFFITLGVYFTTPVSHKYFFYIHFSSNSAV